MYLYGNHELEEIIWSLVKRTIEMRSRYSPSRRFNWQGYVSLAGNNKSEE